MNHIYKTILNKKTGKIVVVSENSSSSYKSQSGETPRRDKGAVNHQESINENTLVSSPKKSRLACAVGLALTSLFSSSVFAATTYTGVASELKNSSSIDVSFTQLIGKDDASGIFDAGTSTSINNDMIQKDAEVTIDYSTGTTPDFVVAGYASVDLDRIAKKVTTTNSINLKQGNVNGNVYAGLVHVTQTNDSIDCSNSSETSCSFARIETTVNNKELTASNNEVNVHAIGVTGDVYAGYAGININNGGLTGGDASVDANAYASAYADAYASALNASENNISIAGDSNTVNDLNAGYAGININNGDLTGGDASVDADASTSAYAYAYAYAYANANALNASENNISIAGDSNTVNDLNAGYAGININNGDLTGGNASAYAYADAYASANANANAYAYAYANALNASENNISIAGDSNTVNDLNAGYAGININNGDLTGGNAYAYADAYAYANANAYAYADAYAYASALNASENNISIAGDSNTVNDLNAGYAGININNGDLTGGDANAYAYASAYADAYAYASALNASENNISIAGDSNTVNDLNAGYAGININNGDLTGGNASAYASANANAYANASANASANNISADTNTVSISGKQNTFNNIIAGYAGININNGDLTGGTKIINGVTSYADATLNIDAKDTSLSANNNKIVLNGSSTVNGNIHTGDISFKIEHGTIQKADDTLGQSTINLTGTSATATGNTITIDGEHTFTNPDATIYGGYLAYNTEKGYKPASYNVFTGNTLNYANKTPITIKEVGNFQTYNFTLAPELANTGTALIFANNITLGSNESNVSTGEKVASDIHVVGIHSGKVLTTDSQFILMQADNFAGEGVGHKSIGIAQQGISLLYDVETSIDKDKKQVIATILAGHIPPVDPVPPVDPAARINPQLKALSEGYLSSLMQVTRGGDIVAYNAYQAIQEQNSNNELESFVILSGDHTRYNSGSHIDADGAILTTGLSFKTEQLILGAFIENGWGNYDSYNTFSNAAKVDGEGKNRYYGLGALAQYNLSNGVYTDASIRAGRTRTDFSTNDLKNLASGESANYNVKADYLSAHVGAGYQFVINPNNKFDLSLKYLWSNVESNDVKVAGDQIHFDSLDSHRLRLNGENSYQLNKNISLLTGVGFEYELDGKASATTYGIFDIDAPSVKGTTGLGTLGLSYTPTANNNLSIDLKGTGYVGQREGVSGQIQFEYRF